MRKAEYAMAWEGSEDKVLVRIIRLKERGPAIPDGKGGWVLFQAGIPGSQ